MKISQIVHPLNKKNNLTKKTQNNTFCRLENIKGNRVSGVFLWCLCFLRYFLTAKEWKQFRLVLFYAEVLLVWPTWDQTGLYGMAHDIK